MFVPFFFLRLIRFRKLSNLEKKQNRVWDREYSHFWEVVSNIRLVKTFATERYEINKLRRVAEKLTANKFKMERIANEGTSADILVDIWTVAIYAYIFYLGFNHQFTIGVVVLLVSYVEMIKQPLWNLSWIFWEVKHTMIGIRDYLKILDAKSKIVEILQPVTPPTTRGNVEFDNVWFKYPEKSGQDVFRGVSFKVEPGKTLALVGKSGVGKTTIANMMVRFFDPDKGRVLIDGIDLRDLSLDYLHRTTGLVMQESHLFDETIAENLRYGKPNATREEMEIACRLSTVQKANEIIVLDNKKIEEQGSHEQLLKKKGIYASLHLIQSGQMEKLKRWDLIS